MPQLIRLHNISDPKYLKKHKAGLAARNSKALLRFSYNFLRMLSLLAEDLTDMLTQDVLTISSSPGWNIFVSLILPFLSALIWLIQVAQDAVELAYTVASKWKRIILLSISIIGTIIGILVIVSSFIAFHVGVVAALPLFIALGSALLSIRVAFMLHFSYKKTAISGLINDRKTDITKLLGHSKLNNSFEPTVAPEIKIIKEQLWLAKQKNSSNILALEKLLRLSLQAQAANAVQAGNPYPWEKLLIEEVLHYEKEKTTERKIELALLLTVTTGSFLLLAPTPITAALGGSLIIFAAFLSISFASIKFFYNSFQHWDFDRKIKEISKNNSTKDTHDFLKASHLTRKGLTNQADQENYWDGLPETLQHKKRVEELSFLSSNEPHPPENRGQLIAQWYRDQLLQLPENPKKIDSRAKKCWHYFKEFVSFVVKKIIFTLVLAPILLVAGSYYVCDRDKISAYHVAHKKTATLSKKIRFFSNHTIPNDKNDENDEQEHDHPLLSWSINNP